MTSNAIDYFSIRHPLRGMASKISFMVRRNIFDLFMAFMNPAPFDRILDVGVTPDQLLPESNFFEQLYPFTNRLTVTSIEDASFLEIRYPGLSFVQTGTDELPFDDNSFDIVFCSAVLEHVGSRMNQQHFVNELLRVARRFFIITPNRQFPIEFHTFLPVIHWLPQPYLSRQFDGAGWSRFGCDYMGICNELAGGWTVWVIRDAAASIGMHDTADKAAGFYRDIARDIERGCSAGTVACTRNPTGNMLAPPMKWIDIFRVLKSGVKMIWMTIWLGDLPGTYHHMDGPNNWRIMDSGFWLDKWNTVDQRSFQDIH